MKIKALLVACGIAVLCCAVPGEVRSESARVKAAVASARSWLSLIDAGRYSDSWQEAASYFHGAISERNWEVSLAGVRQPLGKLVSRTIKTAKEETRLPGAPDGAYVVMTFKTIFENKKSATETVTFMKESNGTWKAVGYFIK